MTTTEIVEFRLKVGTAAAWVTANPVLAKGEPGYEEDTKRAKVGDGATAWNSLPYSILPDLPALLAAKADRISEPTADMTITSNLLTFDISVQSVGYVASAPSANFTINVTNAPTTNDKAISLSLFVVQGATGYIPSALQIAGSAQTILWVGGAAPVPTSTAGKIDIFGFTLHRRGGAWKVFGSSMARF